MATHKDPICHFVRPRSERKHRRIIRRSPSLPTSTVATSQLAPVSCVARHRANFRGARPTATCRRQDFTRPEMSAIGTTEVVLILRLLGSLIWERPSIRGLRKLLRCVAVTGELHIEAQKTHAVAMSTTRQPLQPTREAPSLGNARCLFVCHHILQYRRRQLLYG